MKKIFALPASAKSVFSLTKTGFLILFLTQLSFAQIVIEERVEIEPQNMIVSDNPPQSYSFRVEVDWDAEEVYANDHFWNANLQVNTKLKNNCDHFDGETGFIYGWPIGSNSIEISANAYSYEIFVTLSGFYDSYQFVDLTVRTYLNNEQRDTFTKRVNSGIWPYYSDTVTTSFYQYVFLVEEFDFNLVDDLVEYGCFYTVDLRTNPGGNCSSSVVASLEKDSINLTILTGDEYLTFYDNRIDEIVGTNVQVNEQFINEIDLVYQNPLHDSVSKIAVIQIESNGIVETDSIEILPAPDDLHVTIYPDTIRTGEQASLDIFLDYCPPFETQINVEIIKGQEYGSLIDPITNERTKILTNLEHWFGSVFVDYEADGITSEEKDTVIIMVSTTDPEITPKEATLYIKPPPIYVYTEPEVLGADDTADVFIKHRLEDGTLEDFPPEQTFELGVLDGCVNGNFMVDDSIDVYFADALQPIKFVTADSLDDEFDKVLIRVGTDLSGFMRPVGNIIGEEEKTALEKRIELVGDTGFRRDTLRAGFEKKMAEKKAEAEVKKKKDSEPPIEAPILTQCALDNPTYFFNSYLNIFTLKPEVIIIRDKPLPQKNDVFITAEPKMPEVIMRAILNNYDKGQVKFRWAYWVTSDFPRRNKDSEGNYYNLCHRKSESVFLGYSYANNQDTTRWTVPFIRDSGDYYFKAIWYKGSMADHPAYGCNNSYTEYEGGNEVFTGGEVSAKVIAFDSEGREIDSDSIWVGRLLGQNQDTIHIIHDYASENEIIAIIVHESRTEQFETKNNRYPMYEAGWPKYGYPNGYGLMQIDNTPAAVEEKLWNWKSNIDGGKSRFTIAKSEVQEYIDNNNATYVDSVFYMNAYQNYNSGIRRYWDWDNFENVWKESEYKGNNPEYGRNVYNILKQLNQ